MLILLLVLLSVLNARDKRLHAELNLFNKNGPWKCYLPSKNQRKNSCASSCAVPLKRPLALLTAPLTKAGFPVLPERRSSKSWAAYFATFPEVFELELISLSYFPFVKYALKIIYKSRKPEKFSRLLIWAKIATKTRNLQNIKNQTSSIVKYLHRATMKQTLKYRI